MVESEPAGQPTKPFCLDEVAAVVRQLLASTEELDASDSELCATVRADLTTVLERLSPSKPEEAPKNLEHSYTEEMMHSMIEAVVVARQDGTIHSLNDAAQKLLDYEGLEIIGQPLSVLTDHLDETPEETQERGKILGELFSAGSLQDLAVRARSKDGLTIPMNVNVTLI